MKSIQKMVICFLCIASLLTFGTATAFATELPHDVIAFSASSNVNTVTPNFYGHYTKTITRYYEFGNIPQTCYYEEYNNDLGGWFSGTLTLQSATLTGDNWYECVYSGEIYGQM